MKLRYEGLESYLKNNLAPVYWISGDEPWLINDARRQIRLAANQAGFKERIMLEPDANWDNVKQALYGLSLFHEKKFIEVLLNQTKINENVSQLLKDYVSKPSHDSMLVICSPRLDAKTIQSAWYKAIEQHSATLAIWPINSEQTVHWIKQRLIQHKLQATPQAIICLAQLLEGNLSAIAQEIEKLQILYGSQCLNETDIIACVNQQMQFNLFSLTESALKGEGQRIIHILNYLRTDGIEPSLVLWVITQEVRLLIKLAEYCAKGQSISQALQNLRIIEKKKLGLQQAFTRKLDWYALLKQAAFIDRMIKGIEKGHVWQALQQLCLNLAGYPLPELSEIAR